MHITFLLATLAALAATTVATNCDGDKSIVGYCTPLVFNDTTTATTGAPTTSECQDTCFGVNSDAGDWGVDFAGEPAGAHHLMLAYTCAFSVARGDGEPEDLRFSMANQDILDIIDGAIDRFGGLHGGGIAAEGTMTCQGHNIKWYIGED